MGRKSLFVALQPPKSCTDFGSLMCATRLQPCSIRCDVARRPTTRSSTPTKFAGNSWKRRSRRMYGIPCSSICRKLSVVDCADATIITSTRRASNCWISFAQARLFIGTGDEHPVPCPRIPVDMAFATLAKKGVGDLERSIHGPCAAGDQGAGRVVGLVVEFLHRVRTRFWCVR